MLLQLLQALQAMHHTKHRYSITGHCIQQARQGVVQQVLHNGAAESGNLALAPQALHGPACKLEGERWQGFRRGHAMRLQPELACILSPVRGS